MSISSVDLPDIPPFSSYREASVEVIEVMSRFAVIERASIDEAYMDLTAAVQQRLKNLDNIQIEAHLLKATYVQGYPQNPPERPAAAEDAAFDKGIPKLSLVLIYYSTSCFYIQYCMLLTK